MLHDWQKTAPDTFVHVPTGATYRKTVNSDGSVDLEMVGKAPEGMQMPQVMALLRELTEFYRLIN